MLGVYGIDSGPRRLTPRWANAAISSGASWLHIPKTGLASLSRIELDSVAVLSNAFTASAFDDPTYSL
jgi:hypothetical protein